MFDLLEDSRILLSILCCNLWFFIEIYGENKEKGSTLILQIVESHLNLMKALTVVVFKKISYNVECETTSMTFFIFCYIKILWPVLHLEINLYHHSVLSLTSDLENIGSLNHRDFVTIDIIHYTISNIQYTMLISPQLHQSL